MNDSGERTEGPASARPEEPPQIDPPAAAAPVETPADESQPPAPAVNETPEPAEPTAAEPTPIDQAAAPPAPPQAETEPAPPQEAEPQPAAPAEPGEGEPAPPDAEVSAESGEGEPAPSDAEVSADQPAGDEPSAEPANEPATDDVQASPAQPAATEPAGETKANGGGRGNAKGNGGGKGSGGGGRGRSGRRSDRPRPMAKIPWDETLALVRYGRMSRVGVFRHSLDPVPQRDTQVVIRTERGVELGVLVTPVAPSPPEAPAAPEAPEGEPAATGDVEPPADVSGGCGDTDASCGDECMLSCKRLASLAEGGKSEFGYSKQNKILRLASPQDLNDQVHLDGSERENRQFCEQQAGELGLKMKLVAVEHLLGGERVVFYFTSDSRVDFRELVRRLAGQYRTRIEMRQIGARDEARLVADYERCGQQCCCQVFLGTLQPVSIRMAKVQKATLDPSKISGRCNRLMCCLRYEDQTYEVLRKTLPKKNVWVRTEELVGRVVSTQVLAQLVRVVDIHGAMSVIDNAAILERDVEPPSPSDPPRMRRTPRPAPVRRSEAAKNRPPAPAAAPAPAAGGEGGSPSEESTERKPRRRRRRRSKNGEGAPAGQAAQGQRPASGGADAQAADGQPRKKRRRRRRRRKGGEGRGESSSPPSA